MDIEVNISSLIASFQLSASVAAAVLLVHFTPFSSEDEDTRRRRRLEETFRTKLQQERN